MSTLEKLSELESLRTAICNGCNEEAKKAALAKGKLTARDRVSALVDDNSFVEIGAFVTSKSVDFNMAAQKTPADGVVTGYGTINGDPVYIYSQDATILGGAMGEMHAKKIARVYDEAMKVGVPVVGMIDTVGMRLQESMEAMEGYGMLFAKMSEASGVIPQLAVVLGDCAGGAAFMTGLADFVFMSTKNARMFLNSPNTLEGKASFDTIATAKVHAEESGLAHFVADTEEELFEKVKDLISYLPANNEEEVPFYTEIDDINRVDAALNSFDFDTQDIQTIVESIVDGGQYIEISEKYGTAFAGLARLNGGTVGIIANTQVQMDYAAVKKITAFVKMCDAFNIPMVTLANSERFESTVATEKLGMIKECAKLVHAFSSATVPKVTVILDQAFGSSYIAMNSKHIGADYVLAWPTAKVSTLNTDSAIRIMYEKELQEATVAQDVLNEKAAEYEQLHASAYAAASKGYIDDIIEPAATRKRVIAVLELLATKQVSGLYKKHPTV